MLFKGKIFSPTCCEYVCRKKTAKEHNETQLNTLHTQSTLFDAIDEIPKDIVLSQSEIDAIKQRKMSQTGNLESQLKLKMVHKSC